MKILLITDEEWNDYVYGNGVLTSWFTDFTADFAQIYASPGMPINNICDQYFQITDKEMLKSLFFKGKAGHTIKKNNSIESINTLIQNPQRTGIYSVMKWVSTWMHTPVLMLRDILWTIGRYDIESLKTFICDFKPDIVFCPRMVTPKLMRLEKLVAAITRAPFVAFTGDDEASMSGVSFSPLYWLRKYYIHKIFKKHVYIYAHYFMHSAEQAQEYTREYGISTSTLYKCGDFPTNFEEKQVGSPIRLVYAGRLYCNRWKTLGEIGKALRVINREKKIMVLDIYTQENMTKKQRKVLCPDNFVYVKGSVTSQQLKDEYSKADIALHVESMDKKNRLATRVSFSTKIIDLMASSCAILAICWNHHCGYQYLHDNDAALCVDDYKGILPMLCRIADNPDLLQEYARKAYECGKKNHYRKNIQKQIKDKFEEVIEHAKK